MPCPLPLAPRNTHRAKANDLVFLFLASSAARACTSYRWPPAGVFAAGACTTSGGPHPPHRDRRSSAPLAQPHPRNMPCARKRAVQPNQTRAAAQLATSCADSPRRLPGAACHTDRTDRQTSLTPAVASPIVRTRQSRDRKFRPNAGISDSLEVPDAADLTTPTRRGTTEIMAKKGCAFERDQYRCQYCGLAGMPASRTRWPCRWISWCCGSCAGKKDDLETWWFAAASNLIMWHVYRNFRMKLAAYVLVATCWAKPGKQRAGRAAQVAKISKARSATRNPKPRRLPWWCLPLNCGS